MGVAFPVPAGLALQRHQGVEDGRAALDVAVEAFVQVFEDALERVARRSCHQHRRGVGEVFEEFRGQVVRVAWPDQHQQGIGGLGQLVGAFVAHRGLDADDVAQVGVAADGGSGRFVEIAVEEDSQRPIPLELPSPHGLEQGLDRPPGAQVAGVKERQWGAGLRHRLHGGRRSCPGGGQWGGLGALLEAVRQEAGRCGSEEPLLPIALQGEGRGEHGPRRRGQHGPLALGVGRMKEAFLPVAVGIVIDGDEGFAELPGHLHGDFQHQEIRADPGHQIKGDRRCRRQGRGPEAFEGVGPGIVATQPLQPPMDQLAQAEPQVERGERHAAVLADRATLGAGDPPAVVAELFLAGEGLRCDGIQPGVGTDDMELPARRRQMGQQLGVATGLDAATPRGLEGEDQGPWHLSASPPGPDPPGFPRRRSAR